MKKHRLFAVLAAISFVFTAFGCKTDVEEKDTASPAEVTEFTVTASDGNAVLSWSEPKDADFRGVEISAEPAAGTLKRPVEVLKGTSSLEVTGLVLNTEYTFKVRTFDFSLNYSKGTECKATVTNSEDSTPPAEVTDFTATAADGNALLSWTTPSDSDYAGVKISVTPAEGTLKNPVILGGEVTNLTVSGLKIGSEYTFKAETFDTSLNYSTGTEKVVTVSDTADYTAPAEVTSLTATAADGNAVLTWTNPADEDFAGVRVSVTPAEGTLKNPVILGGEVTNLTVSGLTIGSEYTFKVETFDTSLNYSKGTEKAVTVSDTADYTAPAEVESLTAVNTDASVLLTWKDPSDSDLFGIEITYTAGTSSRAVSSMEEGSVFIAPKTESAKITGLTNGTAYTFTVKTMDLSGNKSVGVTKTVTPAIIEKSPLQITLTPDTTAKTNGDVTVAVSAVTDSASAVKKIAYKAGTLANVSEVLNGTDITESKTFTVTQNASFTVAAQDTAGRRELTWITVSNIDKTAPAPVTALEIGYDYGKKTVTISWKDPADSDFANAELTYTLGDKDAVTVPVAKGKQTYVIEGIEPDVKVMASVKAVDDVNNESTAVNAEITTTMSFAIRSITLSRDHVEYKSGKQITATIKGDNFDLLPSEEKEEALTVKVYDGNTLVTSCTTVAEVDTVNNTATATFTAPDGTDTTTGTTYTVVPVVNVTEKQDATASLRVSKVPSISSFYIYDENGKTVSAISVSDVTAETTVKATVKANNFDIADEIKLAFFDSKGNEVEGASKVVTEEDFVFNNTTSYETFSVNVPVPQEEGVYTLKVMWDGTVISSSYYKTLQIYGVPKFTSFKIPNAGISAKGNQLTATFKGMNFTAPDVDTSLFKVSCDAKKAIVADSSVTVTGDTTATVLLTIPDTAETYTVTLSYGSESRTADFVVKDYSSFNYKAGDVMLSDGTKVDYVESQTFTEDQKSKALAVIFGFNSNGAPLGVGLNNSKSGTESGYKVWASSGTTGYKTKFTDIICTPSTEGSGAAATATFTGDTDGSDNWEYICAVDPEGTKAPSENYPAFNYVLNYASNFNLPEGYKDGWYMPSIAELAELYKNKEIVNSVLSAVGGTQIYSSYYWSSSQYSSGYSDAWQLIFSDGYLYDGNKFNDSFVCCVRAF